MLFDNNGLRIKERTGALIGEAYEQDGIYVLQMVPRRKTYLVTALEDTRRQYERAELSCTGKDKMLWHRRLGHLCEDYMDHMRKKSNGKRFDIYKRKTKSMRSLHYGEIA